MVATVRHCAHIRSDAAVWVVQNTPPADQAIRTVHVGIASHSVGAIRHEHVPCGLLPSPIWAVQFPLHPRAGGRLRPAVKNQLLQISGGRLDPELLALPEAKRLEMCADAEPRPLSHLLRERRLAEGE